MSLTPVRNKQENAINKSRGWPPGTRRGPGPSADGRAGALAWPHTAAPAALDSRTFETLPLPPRCIQNPLPVLRAST